MATLRHAREANRATALAAYEFEQAGFHSAADALKDAALRMDKAIRDEEAALTAQANRERTLARGVS